MAAMVSSAVLVTILVVTCQCHDNTMAHSDSAALEKTCTDLPKVQIFVAVCSHPKHFIQREAIRATWAAPEVRRSSAAVVAFFIGRLPANSPDDVMTREKLANEMHRYNDIIFLPHDDTYRNLTLKTIGALKWVLTHCKRVLYFLKADDDTYVNVTRLAAGLVDDGHMTHRRSMIGCTIASAQPIRSSVSKWYTPVSQYPGAFYPTYLSGIAYVISGDLLADVYDATQTYQRPFWIEDVFITGMCAAKVNATLIHNGLFTYRKHVLRNDASVCRLATTYVAFHEATPEIMYSVAQC